MEGAGLGAVAVMSFSGTLARFELRGALLEVCGDTFFGVGAFEQELLIFALEGEAGFQRKLPAGLHGALDASHGLGGLVWRAELARVLQNLVHEIVVVENL